MFRSGPPRRIQPFLEPKPVPPILPTPPPQSPPPTLHPWRTYVAWLASAIVVLTLFLLTFILIFQSSFYSKNDDEIRSPQALQAEYARWSTSLRELARLSSESHSPTTIHSPNSPPMAYVRRLVCLRDLCSYPLSTHIHSHLSKLFLLKK